MKHIHASPVERARRIRRARTALRQGVSPTALLKRGFSAGEIEEAEAPEEADARKQA